MIQIAISPMFAFPVGRTNYGGSIQWEISRLTLLQLSCQLLPISRFPSNFGLQTMFKFSSSQQHYAWPRVCLNMNHVHSVTVLH